MLSQKCCSGTLQDYKKGEINKCQSKLWMNRNDFSWCLNGTSEETVRSDNGRLFHARGAVTEKARSPRVDLCTGGKTSVVAVDDHRWRRLSTSAVKRMFSARYAGADPLRQRCVRMQRQNVIRSGTRSQWSSRRSGVMRSECLTENTSREAALRMDCSLYSNWRETPASTEQQQSTLLTTNARMSDSRACRGRHRRILLICCKAAKHHLTVAVTCVCKLTSQSM